MIDPDTDLATKPRGKPVGTLCQKRPWLPCPRPECGHRVSTVVSVRNAPGRRLRRCRACGKTFETIERVITPYTGN